MSKLYFLITKQYFYGIRILLIEDDPDIASFIEIGLNQEEFQIITENKGISRLSMLLSEFFDLAIIDLMLPGYDGYTIIKTIREKNVKLPVLILSARREVNDKVKGLDLGADDYLEKPFAFLMTMYTPSATLH